MTFVPTLCIMSPIFHVRWPIWQVEAAEESVRACAFKNKTIGWYVSCLFCRRDGQEFLFALHSSPPSVARPALLPLAPLQRLHTPTFLRPPRLIHSIIFFNEHVTMVLDVFIAFECPVWKGIFYSLNISSFFLFGTFWKVSLKNFYPADLRTY